LAWIKRSIKVFLFVYTYIKHIQRHCALPLVLTSLNWPRSELSQSELNDKSHGMAWTKPWEGREMMAGTLFSRILTSVYSMLMHPSLHSRAHQVDPVATVHIPWGQCTLFCTFFMAKFYNECLIRMGKRSKLPVVCNKCGKCGESVRACKKFPFGG
jgi:hypothetical protein